MKKLFVLLFVGIFLISFTSAFEFDNSGKFDDSVGKYGKYEIRNLFGLPDWLGGGKVADLTLVNNTETCGGNCKAETEITLYERGVLIEEVDFQIKRKDGSWRTGPIRNYELSYIGNVKDYEIVCDGQTSTPNGTKIPVCRKQESGSHLGKVKYIEGEEVDAGTYIISLEGRKSKSMIVDWRFKSNGILTDEWAIWGNISLGDDAEVILNDPADNEFVGSNNVVFNASANVTTGQGITNMSLYTNTTGSFTLNETISFGAEGALSYDFFNSSFLTDLTSYYKFDNGTGIVVDQQGLHNGTNVGATRNATGILNFSFDYDGSTDNVNIDNTLGNSDVDISIQAWVFIDTLDATTQYIISKNGASDKDYALRIDATTDIVKFIVFEGATGFNTASTSAITTGVWHHIIGTWNDGTNAQRLYIDGVLNKSETHAITRSITTQLAKIGELSNGGQNFDGRIDEMGIWNRELSASEVSSLFNNSITFRTATFNKNITGSTLWNVEACDIDGGCGFAPSNFTALLDISAPNITVESPSETIDYGLIGANETLNVTFTDSNLNRCWYNYNGTNITIGGCLTGVKNSTEFLLEEDNTNITIYANDSAGISNSTFVDWRYIILGESETFSTTAVESSIQEFTINITYESSDWNSISAKLNYDETNYTGIILGLGDSIGFIASVSIPQVSVEENKTFNWVFSLTNATETLSIESLSNNQTVTLVDFSICNVTQIPIINFSTYDAENPFPAINATFKSSWAIYDSSGGDVLLNRSYEDITENNRSWAFCLEPSNTNYTTSVVIEIDGTDYAKNFYYITNLTTDNTTTSNISLYLLNDSMATLTEFEVVDNGQNALSIVYISIQLYDIGTDTFYTVGMMRTSSEGKDLTYLNWYDSLYKFVLVQGDSTIYTTTPYKISETPQIYRVPTGTTFDFLKFDDILYSLFYNETSQNFVLTFIKPSGDVEEGCLRVIKRNVTNDYTICETCETSSSATVYCNIASSGNGTFIADFYATGSQEWIDNIYEKIGDQIDLFLEIGNEDGTVMAIIFAGTVMMLFFVSPIAGIIGLLLGMAGSFALGFQPLDMGTFLGIVFLGGVVIWALKR